MPLDPQKIRAALIDPANAGKTAAEIAALFAPVTAYQPLDLATLDDYLQTHGIKQPLKRLAANVSAPLALADGLADFLDRVTNPSHSTIDYADPVVRAKVDGLLAALQSSPIQSLTAPPGVFTTAHAADIRAMGTATVYPAGGSVGEADVQAVLWDVTCDAQRDWFGARANTGLGQIEDARKAGFGGAVVLPTKADLQAIFDPTK